MSDLRLELDEFSKEMERVLSSHDFDKGDSWKNMNVSQLEALLEHEVEELIAPASSASEAVDVGNLSMMIWWKKTRG